MKALPVAAVLLALCLPEPAWAHLVSTRFGELYDGLMHPLTTLQHVVPWLGLGLLGGLLDNNTSKWVLPSFPLSVGIGALLGGILPETTIVTWLNVFSFILLGLLVALALRLGRPAFIGLAILVGLSHGYANGTSELSGNPLLLYVIGVTLAAYVMLAITTSLAFALSHRAAWGNVAVRAAGSWIVAVGLVFGGYTLMQAA